LGLKSAYHVPVGLPRKVNRSVPTSEMGTDPESGYIFGTGFEFSEKIRFLYGMVYTEFKCKVRVCK